MKNLFTWLPRILALLFAVELAVLALDAFEGTNSFWEKLLGFFMHLVPALSVTAFLAIAWKFRLLGGVLFLVLGMIFTIYFNAWKTAFGFAMIAAPLFAAGLLFMLSQWWAVGEN